MPLRWGLKQTTFEERPLKRVCSGWRTRAGESLIAVVCYRKSSNHEGGTKLFSEVLSKRQQSKQVAARQALIGHNRKNIQTASE